MPTPKEVVTKVYPAAQAKADYAGRWHVWADSSCTDILGSNGNATGAWKAAEKKVALVLVDFSGIEAKLFEEAVKVVYPSAFDQKNDDGTWSIHAFDWTKPSKRQDACQEMASGATRTEAWQHAAEKLPDMLGKNADGNTVIIQHKMGQGTTTSSPSAQFEAYAAAAEMMELRPIPDPGTASMRSVDLLNAEQQTRHRHRRVEYVEPAPKKPIGVKTKRVEKHKTQRAARKQSRR